MRASAKAGCRNNRWLNNVMDGGWGQGWIGVFGEGGGSQSGGRQYDQGRGPAGAVFQAGDSGFGREQHGKTQRGAPEPDLGARSKLLRRRTASYNLIYNNVFYDPGGCYFQSSSRGARAYYNDVYANNICYKMQDLATQIYLGNTTNRNIGNDFLSVDAAGKPQPERAW